MAETCPVGFSFAHLYLTDVLIALPLQEVDLFQELLLMVFELPHGDTNTREDRQKLPSVGLANLTA